MRTLAHRLPIPHESLAQAPCRVSVIVIFLNEERFLREAIHSVLAQTYQGWELLLVDDGSTDGSTALAKRYAAQHVAEIRYLEHPGHANRGMSASRNLGIAQARGEFVLFLDGDDVIVPTTLEDQVTFMDAYPEVGTVYGPMRLWRSWDRQGTETDVDTHVDLHLELDRVHHPPSVLTTFLLHEDAVPSGNLLRTELIRKLGGFEDEFDGMYEDQVFRVKLCRVAAAYVSSRVWYWYRKHPDSCCAVMVCQGRVAAARRRFLQWVTDHCRHVGVGDPRVWTTIRRALRPYEYPRLAALQRRGSQWAARLAWRSKEGLKSLVRPLIPIPVRRWIRAQRQ